MNPHEILVAARDLISDPSKWIQHGLAQDAEGGFCTHSADRAVAWCAIGAIYKVGGAGPAATEAHKEINRLATDKRHGFVADNDHLPHSGVLAAFDRAIEATKIVSD